VVAPTTLLTALLFYFGRLHATGYFRYFGVNFTALDLTVQDYLIRSADGSFIPLTIAAGAALIAFWLHRLLTELVNQPARHRLMTRLTPLVTLAGIVLVAIALTALFDRTRFIAYPELGGLCLAGGVLLLTCAVRLMAFLLNPVRGASSPPGLALAEWAAAFLLVSVGLFWAVGSYAIGVGTGRAEQTEAALASSPNAVVFSAMSLNLRIPGVREIDCGEADSAYRFRYDGLKLVLQSGNQYFFLPGGWTRTGGTAVILPRTESLRLEFNRAPAPEPATQACGQPLSPRPTS
jgi:hypothetical protein